MLATELTLDAGANVDVDGSGSGEEGNDDDVSRMAFNVSRLRSRHFKEEPEEVTQYRK